MIENRTFLTDANDIADLEALQRLVMKYNPPTPKKELDRIIKYSEAAKLLA